MARLVEVLTRTLPGGAEESHENPQAMRCSGRDSNRAPSDKPTRFSLLTDTAIVLRVLNVSVLQFQK
jgi:hypothetical protein